jgi:hypothetical protein
MKILQKRSESSEIRKWIIDLAFLALMIFFFYDWKVAKKYECCIDLKKIQYYYNCTISETEVSCIPSHVPTFIPKDFISDVTGSDNTSFNQMGYGN